MTRLRAWCVGDAETLAVFRLSVCTVVLLSADVWSAARWLPSPQGPLLLAVALLSTACTLVGWKTRASSFLAAASVTALLSAPQASGQVLHTHHLVWFLVVLASSPCGAAWSLDAPGPRPAPSLAFGVPVRTAWVLIGLIYFFPGVWKVVHLGAWLDGLPQLVAWKRFHAGLPQWEGSDLLLSFGGVATVLFELCVGGLLLMRRTRVFAGVAAVVFHLAVQGLLGIGFSSLWACFGVLWPWRPPPRDAAPGERWPRASMITAVVLILGALSTGVLGREDTWPFACYPTFRERAPAHLTWVEIHDDGGAVLSLPQLRADHRFWGLSMRTAARPTREALERLHRQATHGASLTSSVRFSALTCELATRTCTTAPLPY